MSDSLPDPCAICGFDGRSLRPPDLVATLRSLGRRWEGVLARDPDGRARAQAEGAVDGLIAAAGTIRADVGRPQPTAAGIGSAGTAIADALEGPDHPFERDGVQPAALAAAHSGTHHLRLAEKAAEPAVGDDED